MTDMIVTEVIQEDLLFLKIVSYEFKNRLGQSRRFDLERRKHNWRTGDEPISKHIHSNVDCRRNCFTMLLAQPVCGWSGIHVCDGCLDIAVLHGIDGIKNGWVRERIS